MTRYSTIKGMMRSIVTGKRLLLIVTVGLLGFHVSVTGQDNSPETADSLNYVTVIVRDAHSKQPISAAQVRTLNSREAATSDENGTLKIAVFSPNDVLEISAFDYVMREVPVRGREQIEVGLYPEFFTKLFGDNEGLNEDVRTSHNPLSFQKNEDLGTSPAVSIDDLLQARSGGEVRGNSRSGVSGIGSTMFIRGYNSLHRNAQPLIVVDGVIWNSLYNEQSLHAGYFGNRLVDINVDDIESVAILKDGTAIYGSKGANGVILIDTKRGESMVTTIEFNAFGGVSETSGSELPMMNGDDYRIYVSELLGTLDYSNSEISAMPFLEDDPSFLEYNRYHNSSDWNDEVYRMGMLQSYNISVKGGDDMALYAFSAGYTGENGIVKNTDMERLNTRFNADFDLSDRFDLGLNIGFTNIDRNLLDDGVSFYTSPTYLAMIKAPFLNPYTYTSGGTVTTLYEDSDVFDIGNPTAIIGMALNTNKHYRLNLGFKPSFIISPKFSVNTLFDYSLDKTTETYYSPMVGVAPRYIEGYGESENVFRGQIMRSVSLFDETQLKYSDVFNQQHRVNGVLGWRYISNIYKLEYGEGHNSGSDQKRNLLNEEDYKTIRGLNSDSKYISTYMNVDYSFDNRLFASASVAVDGSSRFGKETQGGFKFLDRSWGVFPSVNAAWLVSSESFMGDGNWLSFLKLRTSYGLSGNDDIDPYASIAYFSSVRYMYRANGLILGNLANSEIQWETTSKMNVGLDAHFFNSRLALSVDLYDNLTKDILLLRAYPQIVGEGFYWNNEGEMRNRGIEVVANLKVLNLNNLRWEIGASLGHYQNEIVSLPGGSFVTTFGNAEVMTSEGNPAGLFYGYKTDGVFINETAAEAAGLMLIDDVDGSVSYFGAGDMKFVDLDNNDVINEKDKQVIGDPNPDFFGSFSSRIGYKNLTLSAFFKFSYGNDVYNYLRSNLESGSNYSNQTTVMLSRWMADGQETNQPRAVFGDPMGNARFSDRWIEDGSFLRMKSLKINYEIPVKSQAFNGLEIWASANNLWTLTNYLGSDPEISSGNSVLYQGIDIGLLPNTRSFVVGVKLNL